MPDRPYVLVVTSAEFADPLADLLEAAGCDVTIVSELFEGVSELNEEPADAVVVDLSMGNGQGAELAGWVRNAMPTIRVVGLVDRVTSADALSRHADCHETVLLLPDVGDLRRALLLDGPVKEAPRARLAVTLHAELIDANDGILPPEVVEGAAGNVRGLLVGQSKHPDTGAANTSA